MNRIIYSSFSVKPNQFKSFFTIWGIALSLLWVCRMLFNLPDIFAVVLSLMWFLYVPLSIGDLLFSTPQKDMRHINRLLKSLKGSWLIIEWCTGLVIIIILTWLLSLSSVLSAFPLVAPSALGSLLLLVPVLARLTPFFEAGSPIGGTYLVQLIPVLTINFIFGVYVRANSPYPLTPGFDMFSHLYVIKSFLDNSLFNSPLLYLPIFDVLIGLSSGAYNSNLLGIFWAGSILLFEIFGVGLFLLARSILKNDIYSLFATIIGLSATEMGLVSNLQFFYPSSFVMSIFPLSLYVLKCIWSKQYDNHVRLIASIPIFVVLLLVHLQLGSIASALIVSYLILDWTVKKSSFVRYCLRIATISLGVVLIVLYLTGHANYFLHLNAFDLKYLYSLDTKIRHLNQWYSSTIIVFGLFGVMTSAFFKSKGILVIGFLGSLLLFIYFQQIDTIHRIMTLERTLFSLVAALPIALGVNLVLQLLSSSFRHKLGARMTEGFSILREISLLRITFVDGWFWLNSQKKIRHVIPVFIIVVILFVPSLTLPYDIYIGQYMSSGLGFANLSNEDVKVGEWLEKNTPKQFLIYSDPLTVLEMRGLAYRKNIEAITSNETVARLVRESLGSDDAADAYKTIVSNFGKEVLIVLTPRTTNWLKNSSTLLLQLPSENFEPFKGFNKFLEEKYFTRLYHSASIYVFIPRQTLP